MGQAESALDTLASPVRGRSKITERSEQSRSPNAIRAGARRTREGANFDGLPENQRGRQASRLASEQQNRPGQRFLVSFCRDENDSAGILQLGRWGGNIRSWCRFPVRSHLASVQKSAQGFHEWMLVILKDGTVRLWDPQSGVVCGGNDSTLEKEIPSSSPDSPKVRTRSDGVPAALRREAAHIANSLNRFSPLLSVRCAGRGVCVALTQEGKTLSWVNGRADHSDNPKDGLLGRTIPAESAHLCSPDFVKFQGLASKIVQVSCGLRHVLVVESTGVLFSWGSGDNGRLGHGDGTLCAQPKRIASLFEAQVRILRVASGDHHSLAMSTDCRVFSWGSGRGGKLGHGSEQSEFSPREIERVKLDRDRSKTEDTVTGSNSSSNSNSQQQIPAIDDSLSVSIASQHPICGIAAGSQHSALVTSSGYLFTFGSNDHGQLGFADQGFERASLPQRVIDLSCTGFFVQSCACGGTYTLALGRSGKVVVAGDFSPSHASHDDKKLTGSAAIVSEVERTLKDRCLRALDLADFDCITESLNFMGAVVRKRAKHLAKSSTSNSSVESAYASEDSIATAQPHLTFSIDPMPLPATPQLNMEKQTSAFIRNAASAATFGACLGSTAAHGPGAAPIKDENSDIHAKRAYQKSQKCAYHSLYADSPLTRHLENPSRSSWAMKECPHCSQEVIASLSKQLAKQQAFTKSLTDSLERERADAASFRELCMRRESTETAARMILKKVSSLELHSSAMHSFANLVRDTVEGLHARVLELESANRDLATESEALSCKLVALETREDQVQEEQAKLQRQLTSLLAANKRLMASTSGFGADTESDPRSSRSTSRPRPQSRTPSPILISSPALQKTWSNSYLDEQDSFSNVQGGGGSRDHSNSPTQTNRSSIGRSKGLAHFHTQGSALSLTNSDASQTDVLGFISAYTGDGKGEHEY